MTGARTTAAAVGSEQLARIVDGRHRAEEVHPDVVDVVRRFKAAGVRPNHELGVLGARASLEAVIRLQRDPVALPVVEDLLVPGADGRLPARRFDPGPDAAEGPLVVYLHGGGWTLGSIDAADRPCRRLAQAGGATVVSVGYRRAPESPFPRPLEDCVAAVEWLIAHAEQLGTGGSVVLVGDSAGGNLAAATSMTLRDRGGRVPSDQVLVYPVLHPARASPFRSYEECADGPLMTRAEMEWFWDLYVPDERQQRSAAAAPLLADDVGGLPPTTVVVAEHDVLRDEGAAYAQRLRHAGVPVSLTMYRGAAHGFWWMDAAMRQAAELTEQIASLLRSMR